MTKKILILAANPKNTPTLRLDKEVRNIDEGLQRAKQREMFSLHQKWAVRSNDVRRAMLDYSPHIVHFMGHGVKGEGIMFENDVGEASIVTSEALAELFSLFKEVECVLLSACYSEAQAESIGKHVNYVIGMSHEISDEAAIEFAVAFYDALGAGRSITFAYKLGCNAIHMAGLPEHLMPVLQIRHPTNSPVDESSQLFLQQSSPPERFTGRANILKKLQNRFSRNTRAIVALRGMGGVGKTAIAQKLVERLCTQFTGGIFWADLPQANGNVISILQNWQHAFGVTQTGSQEMTHVAQSVRELLETRQAQAGRLLIIIDDIREEWLDGAKILRQVLPGQASLLATTRKDNLARAIIGAEVLDVDVLTQSEGIALLRKHAGRSIIKQEPVAAQELLMMLGCLPLGIKLAGQWLNKFAEKYGSKPIAELKSMIEKGEISNLERTLPWVDIEQPGLLSTFRLSYDGLDAETQKLFRWLSIFSSHMLLLPRVADVLNIEVEKTEKLLEDLVNLALLEWGGRSEQDGEFLYTVHPLVRQFAIWMIRQSGEFQAVQHAYIAAYLKFAETHDQVSPQAHSRLAVELSDLMNAARIANELSEYQATSDFGLTLCEKGEFLITRGYYQEALLILSNAVAASRHLGDELTEAIHLKNMGKIYDSMADIQNAISFYNRSMQIYCSAGKENSRQVYDLRYYLACLYAFQEDYQKAVDLANQNLNVAKHVGKIVLQKKIRAQAYFVLSNVATFQDELDRAQQHVEASLNLYVELGDDKGEAECFFNLGKILTYQGKNLAMARQYYERCMNYWKTTNNLKEQGHTLLQMVDIELIERNYSVAIQYLDEAESIANRIGDSYTQVISQIKRGSALIRNENEIAACREWQTALVLAENHFPHLRHRLENAIKTHCTDSQ